MVRLSDGVAGGTKSATSITAAPTAKLTYDSPAVSTYSQAGGWTAPAGNIQPYSNMPAAGSQQAYSAPTNTWINPPPANNPPVQSYTEPAAPAAPARPAMAPGGFNEFNTLAPEQQQMSQNNWLGGDSDYTAQVGMYQKALDDFVRRITGRIEGFNTDAASAIQGSQKNEGMAADQVGADFGARGLSYSGLFDTSQNKLRDRYKEGRTNIGKNRDVNVQNANDEKANYEAENEISRNNAKRSSLLRMAAQQQLIDSQY